MNAHPRQHALSHPTQPALILADVGESISYRQMVDNADRAAQLFQALGLAEGDTIAIFIENHIRYPELCWAAKNSGITYACVGSQSSVDDAAYIVENSGAKLLISSAMLAATALAVAQRCAGDLRCLMLDGARPGFGSYEDLLAQHPPLALQNRRRGPSMLYSSGTTGRPKGVRTELPDEPPETAPPRLTMLVDRYGLSSETVMVNPGPFYHAAPGRFMLSVQRTGGTVVAFRKFDALATLQAIPDYRATHGVFVPTMFIRMLNLPQSVRAACDVSSMRCAIHLAAPCPIAVKEQMIAWWGPVIEEMYSGTEAVGHTLIGSQEWLLHKGSVGRAFAGASIRIQDEQGAILPPMVLGAIYMYNGHRFEYHQDPEKTRSAYTEDGWASLGDVGYLDAEGYLYLTDRQSHMIISGGVNIYPQEAENLLYSHPAIADVAVIGVPHPEFGEEVKAVVQARGEVVDAQALEADIIAWCRARLTPIKCPRSVDFVDQLPRNEAGKLVKRLVKDRYWKGRTTRI
ncbi:AMP-binding protein [Hydrocarboniphaga sp.]|uniref:AMP-binding protein n=1 Tax=Hydrocarboniphaga sp. TaxID=2033016 RepID=UPI00263A3096|nr:AMP-binding protein [Hydrocarboniphaga sp.]